ncbi:MAG: PIG-L deacetylase family protein [Verrucomicrobiales bacterium]
MRHPSILGKDAGPWDDVRHWLVLAPHPDDFDVVAVTMRHFMMRGARITLQVLSGGASGVEDVFAAGWEAKTSAREAEQHESCALFGLPAVNIRFHRLLEDEEGSMADVPENLARVHKLLDSLSPDGVILPHGNDSNADHRRTFRWFAEWRESRKARSVVLLVRDPKTLGLRVDLIHPYDEAAAAWKAELLRCHHSQHERNLRTRGIGFDERILQADRAAGKDFGYAAVESFECFRPE